MHFYILCVGSIGSQKRRSRGVSLSKETLIFSHNKLIILFFRKLCANLLNVCEFL